MRVMTTREFFAELYRDRRKARGRYPDVDRLDHVIELVDSGMSYAEIGRRLNVSTTRVTQLVARAQMRRRIPYDPRDRPQRRRRK